MASGSGSVGEQHAKLQRNAADALGLRRAYVVPGVKDLTREEVAKYVEERVAPYKKLRGGVVFVDAIPKSPSGKILRKVLREQAAKSDKTSKL